jgi:tetratricopeptide (TPR) repeat protein
MLKLTKAGPHSWRFVFSSQYDQLSHKFYDGCRLLEIGLNADAEKAFRWVESQMPEHLDAIHHRALVLMNRAETEHAGDLWRLSVVIGYAAFPDEFEHGLDRLEWSILENRPFLRCLHGHALDLYHQELYEEALVRFRELLTLNPTDDQMARVMALDTLFRLDRWKESFDLTMRYPDDHTCETLYARALALFKLRETQLGQVALEQAVEHSPGVRAELLKTRHRRPRQAAMNGEPPDAAHEAYEYWRRYGSFWKAEPGALDWLRDLQPGLVPTASP